MNEFSLIHRFFKHPSDVSLASQKDSTIALGIGDDCALISAPANHDIALSIDTLVEGVHFPKNAAADQIAQRALRVSVSDLAAMGARPHSFTLALTVPSLDEPWLELFSQGLFAAASDLGVQLVGGDTTKGPLTLTVQVHGLCHEGEALRRNGAQCGDLICVSGSLGDAAAALAIIGGRHLSQENDKYLLNRFYFPEPRLKLGRSLRGLATACIDVSDGFLADLQHILYSSSVGAQIDLPSLPLSDVLMSNFLREQAQNYALSGGDDYELCFTLPEQKVDVLLAKDLDCSVTVVGKIVSGLGIKSESGLDLVSKSMGYSHF